MHEEADDRNDLRQNKPSLGEEMVKEAEASRARIFGTPGNCVEVENQGYINGLTLNEGGSPPVVQQYSSMVDENYLVIGAHLDGALQNKIMNNEYVDFPRLIPREKSFREDNNRMEIINKGGQTYFVPATDHESTGISNFSKWE